MRYSKVKQAPSKNESEIKTVEDVTESAEPDVKEKVSAHVQKPTVIKKIPLDTQVAVVSNVSGSLIYVSKKISGYKVEWANYNDVEYMELGELVSMRGTDRNFFEENWIRIEDTDEYSAQEIYAFLRVSDFYKNIMSPDELQELLHSSDSKKILKTVSEMGSGMKRTVAELAKTMIDNGEIDSKKLIGALESSLHVTFTP